MQTNCTLYAKVVKNARLKTLRIVFSFDGVNRMTVRNAALVTGDIANADDNEMYVENAIAQAVAVAKERLQTNTVVMV